jgi:starch-binding outer membrane protein, SusD/RagB family
MTTTIDLRGTRRLARSIAIVLVAASCRDALMVENTRDILSEALDNPEAVTVLINGVAGDFSAVYMYNALATGYSSNELQNVGSMTGWREIENGFADNQGSVGTDYNNASRALYVADNAVERMRKLLPDAESRVETARARIYGGFTLLLMADNFCRVTIAGGPPITPVETYARAESHFTEALTIATAAKAEPQRQQALLGRARARLMQGKFADARTDAAQIPRGFSFRALYSEASGRENNDIATNAVATIRKEASVHPNYYKNALYQKDPRTPFLDKGPTTVGADAIRQFVEQRKYTSRSAAANIATWQQARLIEAEAELKLNNITRAVTLINEVRTAATLPAYTGPSTADDVFKQLLYERSAEMWLEGQRFADLRRTNDPFLANRVKCYPLSFAEEQSNPHLKP